jgi:atypical dual specificity phosphatase
LARSILAQPPRSTNAPCSFSSDVGKAWTALRNTLRWAGVLVDQGDWIDSSSRVLVCAYPRRERALAMLQRRGIRRLVNLHQRRHSAARLNRYDIVETHIPIPDFTAPTPPQLASALDAIHSAVKAGDRVALHCGGGLGRSGTVAACYLVDLGQDWLTAVAMIRAARPGAIETRAQLHSIASHTAHRALTP